MFNCKDFQVETGLQLLARLTSRPVLKGLYNQLFSDGPEPLDVIEINGEANVGKSTLTLDIVFFALLPVEYGGKASGVIFFDTGGNPRVQILLDKLRAKIKDASKLQKVLQNFFYFKVCNSDQLKLCLNRVDEIVSNNLDVSLIVFDSLCAFYWSDQSVKLNKLDTYLKCVLDEIEKVTKSHKLVTVYTRPLYFSSKTTGQEEMLSLKPENKYKINLSLSKDNWIILVNFNNKIETRYCIIKQNDIIWH